MFKKIIYSFFALFILSNFTFIDVNAAEGDSLYFDPSSLDWKPLRYTKPLPIGYEPFGTNDSGYTYIINPSTGVSMYFDPSALDWKVLRNTKPLPSGYVPLGTNNSGYTYIINPSTGTSLYFDPSALDWKVLRNTSPFPSGYVPLGTNNSGYTYIINPSTGTSLYFDPSALDWKVLRYTKPLPNGYVPLGTNNSGYTYIIEYNKDKTSPTVQFTPNGNATSKKSHSTKLTTVDAESGVNTRQYEWSTSNSVTPTTWKSFSEGATIATPNGVEGNFYLWVRVVDHAGNTLITKSNAFVVKNTAPTTPTLTVPTVQFEHGDQQIISWNSSDVDGDVLNYALEVSYNNGSTWSQVYNGINKNYTYTVPNNQTQVNFRVRAYDGTAYSPYTTSANKSIRAVMYYWSKYSVAQGKTYTQGAFVSQGTMSSSGPVRWYQMMMYGSYSFSSTQGFIQGGRIDGPSQDYVPVGTVSYDVAMANGIGYSVRRYVVTENAWSFVQQMSEARVTETTYLKAGNLIQTNIQAGYNAYLHNQQNPDGFWWIRGQRVLSEDTTPPIIELLEQLPYGATSTVTVRTFDTSAISATKWAMGDQPINYFATGGTNVTGGAFIAMQNGLYTVYAKDAKGNEAVETITVLKVDNVKPTGILTPNKTDFTNQQVVITAIGTDMESGIKQIRLPNGNYVADSSVQYPVANNGTYTFGFEDYAGNITTASITVSNIDTQKPSIQFTPEMREADFKDIEVQTAIADGGVSGFNQARFAWSKEDTAPSEGWSEWTPEPNPLITQTGGGKWYLHIEAMDHAGNVAYAFSGIYEKIALSGGPSVNINVFPVPTGKWTNQPVDVYVMDSGDSELLAKAKKYYHVSNSPLYPTDFEKGIPNDKKVQLNLQGENFVHIHYILDDGTKISSTSGPYLIDTGGIGDFDMKLVDSSGNEVLDWSNVPLQFVIGDASTVPISGMHKQYRIEGVHTDWQPYTDGIMMSAEGEYRIFGRIINGTGTSSVQHVLKAQIDVSPPTVHRVYLQGNEDGTYDVVVNATDAYASVKEAALENGTTLIQKGTVFTRTGLSTKPTAVVVKDKAGNASSALQFAAEPTVTFKAPYDRHASHFRGEVSVNVANTTHYSVGWNKYSCENASCDFVLSKNATLSVVNESGVKETKKIVSIKNLDNSTLSLVLNGKRNLVEPTKLEFEWNYGLASGQLMCTTNGVQTVYSINGKTHTFTGENALYECIIEGVYGSEHVKSNKVMIFADTTSPIDGGNVLQKIPKKHNIHMDETATGDAYLINAKSDNYKKDEFPFPKKFSGF